MALYVFNLYVFQDTQASEHVTEVHRSDREGDWLVWVK